MKAEIGDELVVECAEPMSSRRTGTIVGLKTADGSPPYLVHWVVGDYESLIFPGPNTKMEIRHRDVVTMSACQRRERCCDEGRNRL
jgi:hypothetical protein